MVQRDMFFGKFLCFSIRILGIICIFVPRLQRILVWRVYDVAGRCVLRFLRNIVLRYAWVFWKLTKEVIEIIQNAFEEVFLLIPITFALWEIRFTFVPVMIENTLNLSSDNVKDMQAESPAK